VDKNYFCNKSIKPCADVTATESASKKVEDPPPIESTIPKGVQQKLLSGELETNPWKSTEYRMLFGANAGEFVYVAI
jgi:hypothetical protein